MLYLVKFLMGMQNLMILNLMCMHNEIEQIGKWMLHGGIPGGFSVLKVGGYI